MILNNFKSLKMKNSKIKQARKSPLVPEVKVKKVLILAKSGVGKTFYAQKTKDVLDLDAFVYQDKNNDWRHFSFVPSYIKHKSSVFAVAHNADQSIKDCFDVVIDTDNISFKVSIEQILSTYIRDDIRGFKPKHLDLNLDGITFSDFARKVRDEYAYTTFDVHSYEFIMATFFIHRYNEKQNEKFNFAIDIIKIANASRRNDVVTYNGDSVYLVTYEDIDYTVKIKTRFESVTSSLKFLNDYVIGDDISRFPELDFKSGNKSCTSEPDAIYRLIASIGMKIEEPLLMRMYDFLSNLRIYLRA